VANDFTDIPNRNYGNVDPSWWNSLKTAGAKLQAFIGGSYLAETQFVIANNQSAAADITGLVFSGASVRSFEADLQIYRQTTGGSATELAARVKLIGVYKTVAASWEMSMQFAGDEIDAFGPGGLLLSITAAGQVQYKSHNIAGTASVSKLKFRYSTMGVET
jgi:hypothetical protein